ncbi:DMT family transporter [Robinsoniella peoriensis]|uniref:DMT family transporter n=1 Tax=Robinsoniella peoriensis TaxID=180332 RepID=UPI0009DDD74F|nr:DMT family transporter [Robinsoniella peoriensis]
MRTRIDLSSVICVIYYGFFVSFISYVLWFKGIEKVPASNAAVFTSMVPVSSIVLSAVVLKETVMGNIWLDWGVLLGGF